MTDKQAMMLQPQISISYRNVIGNFVKDSDLPQQTFTANIYQWFPIVNADGEFKIDAHTYNLYIGREFEIDNCIETFKNEELKKQLISMKESGYNKFVVPFESQKVNGTISMYPVGELDRVYSTWEELCEAITKIKSVHQTMDMFIEISQQSNENYIR